MRQADPPLSPEMLLSGYAQGIFPMAMTRDEAELHWFDPPRRGVMPLDALHVSRSLRRRVLRWNYLVRIDSAFCEVVSACGARPETWINAELARLYQSLHASGHAHSLEIWQEDTLVGGIFGVTLGGAFFGESMFSRRRDASKLAMVWLVDRLRRGGFTLLDTQYLTPHLASLGGIEIPRARYHAALADALPRQADFARPAPASPQEILQRISQTS
ncbi:leucyl/phenylalanyl-tRNA--protein transferase [Phaeovulum sp.]|uniref:leucyl/phenylalanyl-tRNA--protein transferase n=1 Tax=Phaeovulum sp. TaxID=2934796 RepID=UPI002730F242|nr:leucyl/phenylalanyl-tRNA--protein transferase [Phaeovulum sp.]MDP1670081.1 leucyl/phenylalanyl-tRNA--protein transferase [Phaeovulum sp.]MDZ4118323.1 leucyl/phenylalanyl-tRNA--protein transferase [Phaeovulum sp.]